MRYSSSFATVTASGIARTLAVVAICLCSVSARGESEGSNAVEPRRLSPRTADRGDVDYDALVDGEIVEAEPLEGDWIGEDFGDPWDAYQQEQLAGERYGCVDCLPNTNRPKSWQILPEGLIYHSYLAGVKESRLATAWVYEKDEGWLADSTLGARIGLLRNGTQGPAMVQGFQLDFEGAVFLRQDLEIDLDVVSMDFRAGLPLTYGIGRYQTKFAYYHLSSHLGDEYMESNPTVTRINFARDVLVWGHSYNLTDDLRVYGEAGWAFYSDGGSDPWEFQFGAEYSPACRVGPRGSPFVAVNAHLRQEVDFGGNFVAQAGWQWRRRVGGGRFRVGAHYYNGKSPQYEFFNDFERQLGVGLWYDF